EDKRPQSVAEWRARLLSAKFAAEPKTSRVQAAPAPVAAPSPTFDPALLSRLEGALAQHAGPIAPKLVKSAAKKAKSPPELIQLVAAEIEDARVRAAFEKAFSEASRPTTQPRSEPTGKQGPSKDPSTSTAARPAS